MLSRIKLMFSITEEISSLEHPSPELAATALLFEVARADFHVGEAEERSIADALRTTLDLPAEEVESLLELAHDHSQEAIALHPFTRIVHATFTDEEKIRLFECLWQVALVDGRLDKYEEHMLRRIADLLYVSHRDFIRTKHTVQERLGLPHT